MIMDAGHKLFLDRGVVDVEMKDIAAAAQISRATLYRYFSSKQDLAFAILKHAATEQLIPTYRPEREAFKGNGYEKFAQFVEQLVNAYEQFPEFFRYSAMVEYHYGQQLHAKEHADWYRGIVPRPVLSGHTGNLSGGGSKGWQCPPRYRSTYLSGGRAGNAAHTGRTHCHQSGGSPADIRRGVTEYVAKDCREGDD